MSSCRFTSLVKFCRRYELEQITAEDLFAGIELQPFDVSKRLQEDIEEAKQYPLYTEKAKSEFIISLILKELKRKNPFLSLFSGFSLTIEGDPDLSGTPDYVLSAKPNLVEIEAPIFCIFQSKNKAPDEGFAQCAAEMYAARIFNQLMNEPYQTIYGAVTNGFDWVFLMLKDNTVYVDRERYYLNDIQQLLSIMQWIVSQYKPE